ncbi:NUDIX hydrolase [Marinovum sp.]|uniref:NUDIX hydrolase n=1 Tax=Marinovum sp. TaxID=2024839 RepID=UPI003A8D2DE7
MRRSDQTSDTPRHGTIRRFLARATWPLAWLAPMLRRPRRLQTAALCYRRGEGATQLLLITSRGTGRWIIPKGWLMRGKNASEAAATEAWEEAGVRPGQRARRPIGSYRYDKTADSGLPVKVETLVFPIEVQALADDFPEAAERDRRWVTPEEAARMVDEPELKRILGGFRAERRA